MPSEPQSDPVEHLAVVQAHGHPDATAARLVDTDAEGGTWRVTDEVGAEHDVRLRWRRGPIEPSDAAAVEAALAELHRVATSALSLSHAMGEHGALRYAGSASECAPR